MRLKLMHKGSVANVAYGIADNIKNYNRTVICIKEKDKVYQVISILASEKDESVYAFFDYCKEKKAYIFRYEHLNRNKRGGAQKIEKSKITHEFIVNKRVKLSIHRTGFVQLSGDEIQSGIDEHGIPKGIGVFSNPLIDNPIASGPTFGFTCWGLSHAFEILTKRKEGVQYIILDLEEGDFKERYIVSDKKLNTYVLEFFIFPKEANKYVYEYRDKGPYIDHIIQNYLHEPGARFTHPVIDLKFFGGVIALSPFFQWTQFADEVKFGYCIGSPGGANSIHDSDKSGYYFHLMCPYGYFNSLDAKDLSGLEYIKSNFVPTDSHQTAPWKIA